MNVMVVGHKGNMGARYAHICRWLGHKVIGVDIADAIPPPISVDCAIIATPTDMHVEPVVWCISKGIPFLCEKPVSKEPSVVERLAGLVRSAGGYGYMVCNWAYAVDGITLLRPKSHVISYDNWYTGKDGLWHDCIQLAYLAKNRGALTLKTDHPVLTAFIDGDPVTLDDIAHSYVLMLRDYLNNPRECGLWTMDDAAEASAIVERWKE